MTATSIQWIIACDAGANGDRDNGDFDGVGVTTGASDLTGATQATLLPGETYTVKLNPTQCQPTANDAHNIMIQSGTGGFTYEVLNYGGSVANGEVVV